MEERRHFVRLDTRLPITYRVLPSAGTKQSVTRNISGGGICLFLDEPLALGTLLAVEITLPDQAHMVSFTGEVVWCEPYEVIGKTERYRSVLGGVRFVQIDPHDQEAILRYVILSSQPPRSA